VTGLETRLTLPAPDYDLAATLTSGQAFRWEWRAPYWVGVVGSRWVRLRHEQDVLIAETAQPVQEWRWLLSYLQAEVNLAEVLRGFPDDEPMRAAVRACRGLRLLRQDPWECLASFILSSTKQIVQIRQIIASLCARYGEALVVLPGEAAAFAFPSAAALAGASVDDLRGCKMGFRAPYLLETARLIARQELDLARVGQLPLDAARTELMQLPGVGRKIADCVLLFGYGFASAFPVDVWVMRALRQLYFPRRRIKPAKVLQFTRTHFGRCAGYAQQYLFHYMRIAGRNPPSTSPTTSPPACR
jgi:N-glycosylase/DNA lyase